MLQGKDVPAVGGPLVFNLVAIVLCRNHPAQECVINPGVIVGQENAQTFAHLQRQGLRLQLLGVPLSHGKFAFEGQHF